MSETVRADSQYNRYWHAFATPVAAGLGTAFDLSNQAITWFSGHAPNVTALQRLTIAVSVLKNLPSQNAHLLPAANSAVVHTAMESASIHSGPVNATCTALGTVLNFWNYAGNLRSRANDSWGAGPDFFEFGFHTLSSVALQLSPHAVISLMDKAVFFASNPHLLNYLKLTDAVQIGAEVGLLGLALYQLPSVVKGFRLTTGDLIHDLWDSFWREHKGKAARIDWKETMEIGRMEERRILQESVIEPERSWYNLWKHMRLASKNAMTIFAPNKGGVQMTAIKTAEINALPNCTSSAASGAVIDDLQTSLTNHPIATWSNQPSSPPFIQRRFVG